jgi:HTH-type transcriptional regulator / antitoxin HigA
MTDGSFQPNWFSKPGDTILLLMERRQLTVRTLAEELGFDEANVRSLISGALDINANTAARLAKVVGGSAEFWEKRQSTYTTALARAAKNISKDQLAAWIQKFPRREMSEFGWIPKTNNNAEALKSYLTYFGVNGPAEWQERYANSLSDVAFRTSSTFKSNAGALSAWLRQGEIRASAAHTQAWNERLLRDRLSELRKLSLRKSPNNFIPLLKDICASAGVAVVFVRAPSGCRASGATRFIDRQKAMIVLSFRYRSDDHFWFTFFHEVGHLVLHGKEATFVDCDDNSQSDREKEANAFAESVLVPPTRHEEMLALRPRMEAIVRFAVSVGVAPGIIVGQLQHAGAVKRNQLNFLKRRYDWTEIESPL